MHLSNEDTVCSPYHIALCIQMYLWIDQCRTRPAVFQWDSFVLYKYINVQQCHNSQTVHLIIYFCHVQLQCISFLSKFYCDARGVVSLIYTNLHHLHTQLPLPRWAMWRWRGWTATTELPVSVGPHSPSIRQEGSLCTLWHINPIPMLDEWCLFPAQLSTQQTQVWS